MPLPRSARISAVLAGALGALFLALCIPAPETPPASAPKHGGAFAWDRDAHWRTLENEFAAAKAAGCAATTPRSAREIALLAKRVAALRTRALPPDDKTFDALEDSFFEIASQIAACPSQERQYLALYGRYREAVKDQSRHWDMRSDPARAQIYRALYGGRAAVEEVMIARPDTSLALFTGPAAPSAAPSAVVHGVTIHSGDILVSRGGYPTSALIARGNDYPGNFSHVGLVHVDAGTHAVSVIEAHIESGVVVSTAQRYLDDKKLRIMVLRPRADLPAMQADPMLAHEAASDMLARTRRGHIPYDFEMDYSDPSRLFCSEVAAAAYHDRGVTLWTGLSTISGPGLRRWLSGFGVTHFETEEPSDIEYDPQLVVVAEWRDPAMLLKDHIDNAVIDAMLERAENGEEIAYPWWRLAIFRIAKGYSVVLNAFGRVGPVPEGMSAVAALRNRAFSEREREVAGRVGVMVEQLEKATGHPPPYWALLELARASTT